MATKKIETLFAIPTLQDLTTQADNFRSEFEASAARLGRQARGFLPEQGQRGLDVVVDGITDVREDTTKRVVALRKELDSRLAGVTKEITARRKKTVTTIERETRKRVESVYKRISLPVRGDLDGIKRRITRLERKIDQLLEEKSKAA
jgi:polyhydroxyalkanoate synthesis regulator phasin